MEHLLLGLVLFAGTLAAGNPLQDLGPIKEKVLDMALTSFDDQYQGCMCMMEEELGELNHTEFAKKSIYAKFWTLAAAEWRTKEDHVPKPPALRTEHAVALMAYSLEIHENNEQLYKEFDAAVREAGSSLREYLDNFQFKALHFLLTQAVKILHKPRTCFNVFRGVGGIRFSAWHHDLVRFGQFASSSLNKKKAMDKFGNDTFFFVKTCYGVPIWNFSFFPKEEEVLIPPYERFEVTGITQDGTSTHIHLQSKGILSIYNCEWVKGDIPRDGPSIPLHQHHRDGGMGGDSIWGWGHGDSPAAAPVPS
uniref:NAD(P)(+)--arginine ADP-ribosyltransferase n=1 Tax=Calidris pygmaea TaxID=425635 RepID=A0A8C3PQJ1_9CHAR